MDSKKILILNLSKGKIGEDNSRLLGALVITKLQLAAMSRVDMAEEERSDFYLYVDEFQNFVTEAFCSILSEARKYRLSLVLGNQYIAQLEEMTATGKSTRVKDAVFGNVGTIVCFRVGAEDAEFLEKEFMPEFIATDFVNLAKYNIYLKLMIDGIASRPFSAETLPPPSPLKTSNKEKIIKVSRERYGTPSQTVEDKIIRWVGVLKPAAPSPSASPVLYDAKCSSCGKSTKVTFVPDNVRPVYCKSCRKKTEKGRVETTKKEPPKEDARSMSLREAIKKEPISFAMPRKPKDPREKQKRKEVKLDELKKVLDEALKKREQ